MKLRIKTKSVLFIICRLFIILLILTHYQLNAQVYDSSYVKYNFINEKANRLIMPADSNIFNSLFQRLDSLNIYGNEKISILQIGDSHIQADFFSGYIRKAFMDYFCSGAGDRGFVFPYSIAKSNNPYNYEVKFTGKWNFLRNVKRDTLLVLGLAGISVTPLDTVNTVTIYSRSKLYPPFNFNKIRLFHNEAFKDFNTTIPGLSREDYNIKYLSGYQTLIELKNYTDTLKLQFSRLDSSATPFNLFWLGVESDNPGITYNSVGINGAEVVSYLNSLYFSNHLKIIKPALIIISLGTNDASVRYFNQTLFQNNYNALIKMINKVCPGTPIILTTPPSSYYKKKYINKNIPLACEAVYKVAELNNCAVWDLYKVMGGLSSMKLWLNNGLAVKDKLHFSANGYRLQGVLFFNAFLKAYDNKVNKVI
ncbi:MAG: hypothetical protein KA792_02885 [Bacteroidales bacterium]|nr:hypothetical protein [Bacteroidales bacterium]